MNFSDWNKEVLIAFSAIILAGALGFIGWTTVAISERPDRTEVINLIETSAPYLRDRNMILKTLQDAKEANGRLTEAIDSNTRAVIKLEAVLSAGK